MTDNNKQHDTQKGGINPAVAGVVGAAVGAGVAVVASAAMKDDKTRQKVKDVLNNVKDQAMEYVDTMQKEAKDKQKEVMGQVENAKKHAQDMLPHEAKGAKKVHGK